MKWNENDYTLLVKTQPNNPTPRNISLKTLARMNQHTCKRMFSAVFLIVQKSGNYSNI